MSEMIKIPEGWESLELGNILKIETGSKNAEDSSVDGIYPFFTRAEETQKINTYSYDTEALFIAGEGNFRVKYYNGKFEAHQRTYVLTSKDNNIDLSYLQKAIQPKITRLISTSVGSTVMSLRKPQIAEIDVLSPKQKKEQQKIAEVLSEVDNAISKTEELFEKNKRIKTALMQDLLNYGIDGNGKIRNPQTHIFKPSELGDIPEEWNCVELGRVCDVRDGTHDSPNYINYGIPFVTSKNLMDTGIDFKNVNYIKEDVHKLISNRSKVENGDILFGMIGTIGKPVIVNTDFEFSIKNVALIKKIKLNFDNIFLLNFLKSNFFNKNVTNIFNGGVQNFISLGMVRKLLILQPEISEQQKIAQILSSQDEKIEDIKNKLNKLKSLKASLMQDLLSGKVRVTKLMEENS
ncbi:restriction endonuclease subunit S [Aliarcobacter skirrowii]|uniref:restriction endonuclease subunit S n=1 Tax=Aliarcobacter skirrowii TaxID=28200 RepID=UPI000834AFC9|nr:restriction endonuclease subunit S [Aliarcobacter skirrowii]